MKQQYISRGSQWRKWDLHVHTKGTMKNDDFNSNNFNEFCVAMFKKAIDNEIAAIGITDYFNIKNYLKVKKFVDDLDDDEKSKVKDIFLLPNVELRMLPATDSGRLINIHCLFNPDYVDRLDHDFFAQLQFNDGSSDYLMTNQGIINLGKASNPDADDDAAYRAGVGSFIVDYHQLGKLLNGNHKLRNNTIVVVSNSRGDGASGLQDHYALFGNEPGSLDAARKAIYKMSDAIFSSNPEDRKFFLGKKGEFNENHVQQNCGSLKPCIHGSDAHTEEDLFQPDKNRYCWIKADLTFEGLKQILYEPEDRVLIQADMPESKRPYNLIDKVKFVDDDFMEDEICLSQNLTAIIGGKSTGKSRLLGSIAQHIDPVEVAERISHTLHNDDIANKRLLSAVEGFEVTWEAAQENADKKITYIPQSYLNKLADATGTGSGVHSIIDEVLQQKCQKIHSKLLASTSKVEQRIAVKLVDLFADRESIKQSMKTLRSTGNRIDVEADINSLNAVISELNAKGGLNSEQQKKYENLTASIESANSEQYQIETDIAIFEGLGEIEITSSVPQLSGLSSATQSMAKKKHSDIQATAQSEWRQFVVEQLTELENRKNSIGCNQKKFAGEIAPLTELIKNSGQLNEKKRVLNQQQSKRHEIIVLEQSIEAYQQSVDETIDELLELSQKFYGQHDEARQLIDKKISEQFGNLTAIEIVTKVNYKEKHFRENFLGVCFDGRSLSDKWKKYKCNENDFQQDVECALREILDAKMTLNSGYTKKDAVTTLLKNWCELTYAITADGDSLARMSPGKRAFVLLKCIVELDNSKHPLLLDQPEDDLDNRTIYNDLVRFIKEKKKYRQIIIATHNPNLVIGADAECIIVANQRGTDSSVQKYKFEYVSGAIENTFPEQGAHPLRNQGIREHVCAILEGGDVAFKQRERKYGYQRNA